jgi:ABC-2 type transport system permease protein
MSTSVRCICAKNWTRAPQPTVSTKRGRRDRHEEPSEEPSEESSKVIRTAEMPVYDTGAIRSQSIYEFKELIRYRFLVSNLVARDLKVRYKRSVLGFIWVMLNPLLTMGVLVVVFSNFFRFTLPHYPVYLLCGILIFNLFSQGSVAAMSNLTSNGNVLRRMYVPPSVFIASAIGSALVNLLFSIVPFFVLALVTGVRPSVTWAFIFVPCVETALFAFGVGLIVAPMMVFFNDTYEIYAVLVTALNYLTPVFYPVTILPQWVLRIEKYNPLFLYMDTARTAALGGTIPHTSELIAAAVMALGTFIVGWLFFTRVEGTFALHF